jgi:hypothetical protein
MAVGSFTVAGVSSAASDSSRFESEAELQQALAGLDLAQDERFPYMFVRREVPVAGCVPDLVIVRFADLPSPTLWPARRSFRHAYVLWILRRHGRLRVETVADKMFEPIARTRAVIGDLLSTGALAESRTGAVFISPSLAQVTAEVIAIEAKLSRWRDALAQAVSYQRFSDRVLVAMDSAGIPRTAEALDEFRRAGAGLVSVTRDAWEWVIPPRRPSRRRGPEWDYLVSSAASPQRQTLWSFR